ncbi:MAG: pyridoxamine 5'-phosphate oxidase family protein [Pseudomonadales bacterium]|nr:pyridoxamine 5'-phosphate oxidase family protein [Pseudomonadales bacterium]
MDNTLTVTPKTRVKRAPKRAVYERDALYAIFDEAIVAHVGFQIEGQPFVIPTLCWRAGNSLYIHGAGSSRMLKHLDSGAPVCVTATHLDGLILAKSAFHHTANYRSACVFGSFTRVIDEQEWIESFRIFTEQIAPGRWEHIRPPSAKETKATHVFKLSLDEASVKVRTGPPNDDPEDQARPVWSGEIPVRQVFGPMQPDQYAEGITEPDYSEAYGHRWITPVSKESTE